MRSAVSRSTPAGSAEGVLPRLSTDTVAPAVEAAARDAGYLVNAPAPDVIRLAPPLILTAEQAGGFVAALPQILDTAAAEGK